MKIVVTNNQDFTEDQKAKLDSLGEIIYFDTVPSSSEEYLQRVQGADIICSGTAGFKDAYSELKDVYVTVNFVSLAFVDLEVLTGNNVKVSNAPGANKHAVSEWIIYMMLLIQRDFNSFLNTETDFRKNGDLPPINPGLAGKNVTILGYGNIAQQVGKLLEVFGMNISHFRRGDNLTNSIKSADIVVDTLSSNPSSHNLLNSDFFHSFKKGASFISVTREEIIDTDAMIEALDKGIISHAALDCGGILVGDVQDPLYQKLLKHNKVLVTPHISYNSEMSGKLGNDIMIDNVESWTKGEPQNLLN